MRRHAGVQSVGEKLLGACTAVIAYRAPQKRSITDAGAFSDARQDFFFGFGKPIDVVDEIDEQKFRGGFGREGWFDAELERAAAEREFAMPLMIVDDGLVVELCRADAEAVVGIDKKLVSAFLRDSRFLLTSPKRNQWLR